jgi:hypothetical protein
MTFYPSTQTEMQSVIEGLKNGDMSATKKAVAILEQVLQTLPFDQEQEQVHCSYCGIANPVDLLEVDEGDYEYMEGREVFPLCFCGEGCLNAYVRENYGDSFCQYDFPDAYISE